MKSESNEVPDFCEDERGYREIIRLQRCIQSNLRSWPLQVLMWAIAEIRKCLIHSELQRELPLAHIRLNEQCMLPENAKTTVEPTFCHFTSFSGNGTFSQPSVDIAPRGLNSLHSLLLLVVRPEMDGIFGFRRHCVSYQTGPVSNGSGSPLPVVPEGCTTTSTDVV